MDTSDSGGALETVSHGSETVRYSGMTEVERMASLVRDLEQFFGRYVILPPKTVLPLSIWTALTYIFSPFDAVPYLILSSPAPRCGKTRLLECLELVVSRPRRASNISEAALFRCIEKSSPTLLLDEAETLNAKSERAEYLRQILNAGNRRGAVVTRCVGQGLNIDTQDFSVFCPKVLAGIGDFPPTITDRAIVIPMQRRKGSETVSRFLYKIAETEGIALREQLSLMINGKKSEIEAAYSHVSLDFISDRDAEAWSPLFAILAVLDPSRLEELRDSAISLTRSKANNAEDDDMSLRLLADTYAVWPENEPKIFTAELIRRLRGIEDGAWAADDRLDGRRLSRRFRPFGISPATVQIGSDNKKGYYRQDAEVAFRRYLTPQPS
jgi:hypothetical protein